MSQCYNCKKDLPEPTENILRINSTFLNESYGSDDLISCLDCSKKSFLRYIEVPEKVHTLPMLTIFRALEALQTVHQNDLVCSIIASIFFAKENDWD